MLQGVTAKKCHADSMALLRMCVSRSAVQNCNAETAAFHIEHSLAKGQYCIASMV